LPEEEYGNQEEVEASKIKYQGDTQELLKRVIQSDRDKVVSGSSSNRPRTKRARSRSPPPRYESVTAPTTATVGLTWATSSTSTSSSAPPSAAALAQRKAILERYGDVSGKSL